MRCRVTDFTIKPLSPHLIAVHSPQGRQVLTLNFEPGTGKLIATYDPNDLDEAARIFIEHVVQLGRDFGQLR